MITNIPAPKNAPDWFVQWLNEFNRNNAATVNRSQGKTNPTTNIQTFSSTCTFTTDGSGAIRPINILNKLSVNAKAVVLGRIARTDGGSIAGTPQIVWYMDKNNITISQIGGLAATTEYVATFIINI